MRSKKLLTLILSVFIFQAAKGGSLIDSLKAQLKIHTAQDTARCHLLIVYADAIAFENFDEAVKQAKEAKILAEKINYPLGVAYALRQLGALYLNTTDMKTALDYTQKAIKVAIEIGDTNFANSTENNIGRIYTQMGDYKSALPSYRKLFEAATARKNEYIICLASNNMALSFMHLGELDSASLYFRIVIDYGEKNNDATMLAYGHGNYAAVLDKQQKFNEALDEFKKAREVSIKNNIDPMTIQATAGIAEANIYLKNYDTAATYALQAIELSRKARIIQNEMESWHMLTDIYKSQKKFDKALDAYQQFILIKDSLTSEENKSEIIRKDLEFKNAEDKLKADAELKAEKKLKNIYLIVGIIIAGLSVVSIIYYKRSRDSMQKQKEAELEKKEAEQEKLNALQKEKETASILKIRDTELKALRLQMNPHFIDNALQSIQHFMNSHQPDEAEEYLIKFSMLMRSVLMNSEREEISVAKELETLEWYLELENLRMKFPFTYKFHVDENIDVENVSVPPNILQPFVENSIKHGLSTKDSPGNIDIYIGKNKNDLHIIIEDNGIGRSGSAKEQLPALFKRESLGIKITQERLNILSKLKNISASFKIIDLFSSNNLPSGTRVELNLPEMS